jgi:hypothetical protein
MATRMQQRRGTAAQWISTNSGNGPILNAGEIGFETDTNKFKIGDGTNHWINLDYFIDANSTVNPAFGSSIVFEGATANAFETTVAVTDPTADRTITLPDASGTVVLADGSGNVTVSGDLTVSGTTTTINSTTINATTGMVFEGATANDFETTLTVTDPTADRTLTLPDASGTLATTTDISNHESDTTSVHGIADTAQLATKAYADTAVSTHDTDTTSVHGIADTSALATKTYADTAVSTHDTDTTSVHGIADTAQLATKAYADSAVSTHNSATTNVHGISDTSVLTTASNTQTLTGKTLTSPKINEDVALTATATELNYVDGVTSAIQTQLNDKAPIASPTFTGTVAGVTKTHVGLGNVDNTTDANKPVSTATQTALDLKAPIASPTFTGTVTLPGAPTSDLHAATKLYVDNVTAGINFHQSVHVATTANLSADYNNGTNGIGATLTASANAAWPTIDGHTSFTQYDRILVKNQTDAKQNGIYILSDLGGVSSKWILTRATDADNNPTGEMKNGDFVLVINGTTQASVGYINNSAANPIVIGTDNITYTEFSAGKTVVAGNGLQEATPGTLSIDTSITATKASVDLKAPIDAPTFTGLVTVAASGVAFTDGTQILEGVPSRTPIIQKTDSYTLSALTERDSLIEVAKASATTITIPLNSAVAYPVGTSIDILQTSTGQVTIAGDAGVTVNSTPGLKLRTQWSSCTLFKRATNTWVVFGDLTA